VRLAKFFSHERHCLGWESFGFFGNLGSKVAWSHWGLNSGPSVSQPDAMAISILKLHQFINKNPTFYLEMGPDLTRPELTFDP